MIRISKKKIFLFIFDKFGPKKNEEGRFKLVTFALLGMMLADCSTPWGCKNVLYLTYRLAKIQLQFTKFGSRLIIRKLFEDF